jgi:hypothetical protein
VSPIIPSFGRTSQRLLARSRTALIHAASLSPLRAAAALYAFLRASERRISSLSSSPSPNGGRPGGRLSSSMAEVYARTKPLTRAFYVRTIIPWSRQTDTPAASASKASSPAKKNSLSTATVGLPRWSIPRATSGSSALTASRPSSATTEKRTGSHEKSDPGVERQRGNRNGPELEPGDKAPRAQRAVRQAGMWLVLDLGQPSLHD